MDASEGGVGFIVHRKHTQNIIEIKSISTRVVYLILKLNTRYSMKVIQAYAPTSTSEEEEVEIFYDKLNEALRVCPAHYTLLIDDFNATLRRRQDKSENSLGKYGYGERNQRDGRLLNFLQEHGLYSMSSFFDKKSQQKWAWVSSDGNTKNEIDFIISNRKEIIHNVTALNNFSIGSDHRIRSKISINTKSERMKMMRKTNKKWIAPNNAEAFQNDIDKHLNKQTITKIGNEDINALNRKIVDAIKQAKQINCAKINQKNKKLNDRTKNMMKERRELQSKYDTNFPKLKQLNKDIPKAIRSQRKERDLQNAK